MKTPLLDEDMIHNWEIPAYDSVRAALSPDQAEAVQAAWTSAREEAKTLNAAFAL